MHWISSLAQVAAAGTLEQPLRDAVDKLRADSGLKSPENPGGGPPGSILDRLFLRCAEVHFAARRPHGQTAVARVLPGILLWISVVLPAAAAGLSADERD